VDCTPRAFWIFAQFILEKPPFFHEKRLIKFTLNNMFITIITILSFDNNKKNLPSLVAAKININGGAA